jgi:hypothetical protein
MPGSMDQFAVASDRSGKKSPARGGAAHPLTGALAKAEDDYRSVITNPLRSAATISPDWKPDSVSTAPF